MGVGLRPAAKAPEAPPTPYRPRASSRLYWEYRPGSELFVVYNEQRDTLNPRFPRLENRAFVVKINRLFRF